MKIKAVKGTRDFYPPMMAVHNHIVDGWKTASRRNGFEEYEGPIFEYLKMYQVKSGDEIVEQLFNLTDRGGRELAIRPEITPTLARMVNAQINSLSKPVKWFSVPRMCRAERPQKGRLREFWQWNIDIIGIDEVIADAEVIFTTVDYLISAGLGKNDIKVKISSRKLLASLLESLNVNKQLEDIYLLLDKKAKIPSEAFQASLHDLIQNESIESTVKSIMEVSLAEDISNILSLSDKSARALEEVNQLFQLLETMGIADYCVFDMSIVRGLAYYTGIVFEVHDVAGDLRAICGGGRYDNLLKDFGGPAVSATGMGMGDAVLGILLEEKGLLSTDNIATKKLDYFVVFADSDLQKKAVEICAALRFSGLSADFSYKAVSLGKQLKAADSANASHAVIVGQELLQNAKLTIKDMKTGNQSEVEYDSFINQLKTGK